MLHNLLDYLVDNNGLTDAALPFTQHCGGSATPVLRRSQTKGRQFNSGITEQQTLSEIRNSLAHGDPFDGLPWGDLLELVRNLIEYAYRSYLQELRTGFLS